jgi:PUA-domain protein
MSGIMIRKRKRMKVKEIRVYSEQLEEALGVPVFGGDDQVDFAESSDFDLLFADGEIVGLVHEGRPFLTVRGLIRYRPELRAVTVDMGAVPFVSKGADCMGPGIIDADPGIAAGDMVWIRDERNRVPLAVGISERSGEGLMSKAPGKAVLSLHHVGDRLWKAGE